MANYCSGGVPRPGSFNNHNEILTLDYYSRRCHILNLPANMCARGSQRIPKLI
jgi:hypothetical protein